MPFSQRKNTIFLLERFRRLFCLYILSVKPISDTFPLIKLLSEVFISMIELIIKKINTIGRIEKAIHFFKSEILKLLN